jgi:nucleoside 2-deoxyribosyltransferase
MLNEAAIPAFKNIATIGEFLAAQEGIIQDDPYRRGRGWTPALPATRPPGLSAAAVLPATSGNAATRADLFVIMPFSEPWSDGTYALIRRAVGQIDAPDGALRLYRADEIAEPGQITQQVKAAIDSAHVIIADATHVNPNVMWELGYADGLGKAIVILNQDPQSSPFDIVDRRQVAYDLSSADKDEQNLIRHLTEALRIGHGLHYQVRTNKGNGHSATLRR